MFFVQQPDKRNTSDMKNNVVDFKTYCVLIINNGLLIFYLATSDTIYLSNAGIGPIGTYV